MVLCIHICVYVLCTTILCLHLLYMVFAYRFDDASRQFVSPERSYKSILTTSSDVKELIPEFFFLPEFLCNINGGSLILVVH